METEASDATQVETRPKQSLATGAWVCPILAWVVTALSGAVGRSAGAVGNGLLALAQLGLLVAGLVLALVVLSDKQARSHKKTKRAAVVGLVLSLLTLALVAIAIVGIVAHAMAGRH